MNAHFRRFLHDSAAMSDGGFHSLGDFLIAVRNAAIGGGVDKRLVLSRAPAGEADPTTGGYTVPEVWTNNVIGSIYEESVLAPLCDVTEMAGPLASIKEPAFDETSRQDGSRWGGTLGYWTAEADNIIASKPKFRLNEFSPKKLTVLSYVTSDLFRDANLLSAHFERAMKSEGSFQLDRVIFAGTGGGVPLGILSAPCTIVVAKEAGQAAGTVVQQNISAIWKLLPAPSRPRAVWLVNEDVESMFDEMAPGDRPNSYMPAGAHGSPFPLLKGRPMIAIEQASPLGTVGDIVLADLSRYRVVQGSPRFALSADVAFLTDELAFRFTFRVDGLPAWSSTITPFNGSNTPRSPFVTLAAR